MQLLKGTCAAVIIAFLFSSSDLRENALAGRQPAWLPPPGGKPFISGSGVIYENFASYQRDVKKLRLNKWLNVLSAAE